MKIIIYLIALITISISYAYSDDPEANFLTKNNFTTSSKIHWIPVKNLQATCEAESRKRKFGGFGYAVEACSFWDKEADGSDTCFVYTNISTNTHTLGHEIRHCFQGSWHK